jgi:S1-C subfamily serine protease
MKRVAVYSTSSRSRPAAQPAAPVRPKLTWREWRKRHAKAIRLGALGLTAFLVGIFLWTLAPEPGVSRQEFEAALEKLAEQNQPAPSAADAYESILPSVVHVRGITEVVDAEVPSTNDTQSGTGVVIVDDGTILTNLHVVHGSKQVRVVFHDGLESEAVVIGVQPEHDLAVLKARTIPDDLSAATLRSTQGLRPGEPVVAVGFPFGIGPSVSAGVISGLGREYQTADGRRALTNLIQFDAAVNPGNSGGPLITPEGEVIGIVTGLLNPTEHRVFIGIGFAVPIENAAAGVGLSPF